MTFYWITKPYHESIVKIKELKCNVLILNLLNIEYGYEPIKAETEIASQLTPLKESPAYLILKQKLELSEKTCEC